MINSERISTGISGSVPGGNREENVDQVHEKKSILKFILGAFFKIVLADLVRGTLTIMFVSRYGWITMDITKSFAVILTV